MRSRAPRPWLRLAALLCASAAFAEDLPPAPAGFAWKRIDSVRAAFLVPVGWHFKEEEKDGTRAFFITMEDIDRKGEFETGLTVNVQKLHKDPAQQRAAEAIAGFMQLGEIQDFFDTESGVLKGYGCRIRRADSDRPPLILEWLAIGNSRTNTIYLICFESPEASWKEAWEKGETIFKTFRLDEGI